MCAAGLPRPTRFGATLRAPATPLAYGSSAKPKVTPHDLRKQAGQRLEAGGRGRDVRTWTKTFRKGTSTTKPMYAAATPTSSFLIQLSTCAQSELGSRQKPCAMRVQATRLSRHALPVPLSPLHGRPCLLLPPIWRPVGRLGFVEAQAGVQAMVSRQPMFAALACSL